MLLMVWGFDLWLFDGNCVLTSSCPALPAAAHGLVQQSSTVVWTEAKYALLSLSLSLSSYFCLILAVFACFRRSAVRQDLAYIRGALFDLNSLCATTKICLDQIPVVRLFASFFSLALSSLLSLCSCIIFMCFDS